MPIRLHVIHDHGGGIARWCRDFCLADAPGVNLVLAPYSASDAMGEGLVLYAGDADMTPLACWPFTTPIQAVVETHPEYRSAIEAIVRDYGVGAVLVSSLIGHALDVLDTGLPTLVVNHDYFPLCPMINLHFREVCRQCDEARLADCAAHNPNFNPFPTLTVAERLRIRARYLECVTRQGTVMVVPDESVRRQLLQVFPALRAAAFVTIAHGTEPLVPVDRREGKTSAGRLCVMVLGILPAHKGLHLLREALPALTRFAEVHLVGARAWGELFRGMPGVHVIEGYTLEELPALVAAIAPDVGLLPSIVPETFSYTLSELFQLGIPPVATRLGAFASRIRPGETGYLFAPDAASLLDCLRAIDVDRDRLRAVAERVAGLPIRTTSEMVADYRRLLPPLHGTAAARLPGRPDPALLLTLERARHWKTGNASRQALEMQAARLREVLARQDELQTMLAARDRTTGELEDAVRTHAARCAESEARLAALYASTSWRVSAPVRWMGTFLRRLLPRQRHAAPQPPVVEAAPMAHLDAVYHHYRETLMAMREPLCARGEALYPRPRIVVLLTVREGADSALRDTLEAMLRQWYPDWVLYLLGGDGATPALRAMLEDFAGRDTRLRLALDAPQAAEVERQVQEGAAGEFVVLLEDTAMPEAHAMLRIAAAIRSEDPDMLYADAIRVADDGETVRNFELRPMFSPEYLRARPNLGPLVGLKPALLRAIGGFGGGLAEVERVDLVLRAAERAGRIAHIPEPLARTRRAAGWATPAEQEAWRAALQDHLRRCGEAGEIMNGPGDGFFDVRYPLAPGLKVAIIIPTKNQPQLVRACIESIERTVAGVVHDIVLVDHESDDPVALAYFDSLRARVTLLRHQGPFNFAAINNRAVARLDGSHTHYLFCNNDVEAIEPGWLGRMLELGQKPDVGVVGAKLYYPDRRTIQHAGVVVACCGVAENLGRFRETPEDEPDLGYLGSLVCNREVSAVTGACMLVRRNVFEEIGGFDETIAVGYGDVDLCLRAGQRGYRTLFCAHAVLLHHESYTRGRTPEDPHPEDSARFLAKWRETFNAGDPYFNPNLSPHSPNWQVAEPLEARLEVRARLFVRRDLSAGVE